MVFNTVGQMHSHKIVEMENFPPIGVDKVQQVTENQIGSGEIARYLPLGLESSAKPTGQRLLK